MLRSLKNLCLYCLSLVNKPIKSLNKRLIFINSLKKVCVCGFLVFLTFWTAPLTGFCLSAFCFWTSCWPVWGTVLWSWPDSSSRPGTGTGYAYRGPSEHSWSALWSSTPSLLHPRWSGAGETSVASDIYPLRPAVYRGPSPPPCTGLCTISPAGQSGTKGWSCGSPRCCKAPGSAPGGRPPAPERGWYSRYRAVSHSAGETTETGRVDPRCPLAEEPRKHTQPALVKKPKRSRLLRVKFAQTKSP